MKGPTCGPAGKQIHSRHDTETLTVAYVFVILGRLPNDSTRIPARLAEEGSQLILRSLESRTLRRGKLPTSSIDVEGEHRHR